MTTTIARTEFAAPPRDDLTAARDAARRCLWACYDLPINWTMAKEAYEAGTATGNKAALIRRHHVATMTEEEFGQTIGKIIEDLRTMIDRYDAAVGKAVHDHILIATTGRERPIQVCGGAAATAHGAARAAANWLLTFFRMNDWPIRQTASGHIKSVEPALLARRIDFNHIDAEINIEWGLAVKQLGIGTAPPTNKARRRHKREDIDERADAVAVRQWKAAQQARRITIDDYAREKGSDPKTLRAQIDRHRKRPAGK